MPRQLLIYESAVPVSRARHEDHSVEVGADYAFTRTVNAVPLNAVEFPFAAPEYAIVFAGNETAIMPAVVLGLRDNENLYLKEADVWDAKYVPAFIRRYPFVFSTTDDGKTFTLCIDEKFPGFNRSGKGERLFGKDGKPSAYTDRVLKFLEEYQAQFQRTQAFCRRVKELDLLEPMQAQVTTQKGDRVSLGGFMAINRDRLKKLGGEVLAQLASTDELELIYLHLQSMRNLNAMRDRLSASMEAAA